MTADIAEIKPARKTTTALEIATKSRERVDVARLDLDVAVIRTEQDRMANATVHAVVNGTGFAHDYAAASDYARLALVEVVAERAAQRTNGFRTRVGA